MSSKAAGTVARAFPVEAEIGFRFLTEQLGLSEPVAQVIDAVHDVVPR